MPIDGVFLALSASEYAWRKKAILKKPNLARPGG